MHTQVHTCSHMQTHAGVCTGRLGRFPGSRADGAFRRHRAAERQPSETRQVPPQDSLLVLPAEDPPPHQRRRWGRERETNSDSVVLRGSETRQRACGASERPRWKPAPGPSASRAGPCELWCFWWEAPGVLPADTRGVTKHQINRMVTKASCEAGIKAGPSPAAREGCQRRHRGVSAVIAPRPACHRPPPCVRHLPRWGGGAPGRWAPSVWEGSPCSTDSLSTSALR